jgi:cysteine desulfurase / selenocysteine lyase
MFDAKVVRKDFPIMERILPNGKPLIYLDSAATSQKPRKVIDSMVDFYERYNANVHRGVYTISEEATAAYEGARETLARFIGAPDVRGLVFTKSTTEAINLVSYAWARKNLRPGDEILITAMEHHSNTIPWQFACQATGAKLVQWDVRDDGTLDLERLPSLLTERTKLVCVAQMSNVLGTINPVPEIAKAAHSAGALVLVDGAQGAPHLVTNVAEMDCDFYGFSGHKMCGPTGSGALWARPELLEAMDPFLGGGEMIREVWYDRATYNEIPYKFEAGTQPIAEAIGMGAAAEYLSELGMDAVREHEVEVTRYALDALGSIERLRIFGPKELSERGAAVSFWMEDVHPHDIATIIDTEGIAIRAGHHCAQPLMRRLGVPATARASFYIYNTSDDVDALVAALDKARTTFAGMGL